MAIVAEFKKQLKEKNITFPIRAQKAGCLDVCDFGQTVVVYPEGVFYVGVEVTDVEEIISQHILGNQPVERLLLKKKKE